MVKKTRKHAAVTSKKLDKTIMKLYNYTVYVELYAFLEIILGGD